MYKKTASAAMQRFMRVTEIRASQPPRAVPTAQLLCVVRAPAQAH